MKILLIVMGIVLFLIIATNIYMVNLKKKIKKKRFEMSNSFKKSIENKTFNDKNEEGQTQLMIAILGKFNKSAKNLIEAGADINIRGNTGEQALHLAAHQSNPDLVRLLINNGAEINSKDFQGCTPIWYASQNNKYETVKILIEKNADLDIVDNKFGLTPLMIAAQNGAYKVVDLLVSSNADKSIMAENFGTAYDIAKERLEGNIKNNKKAREELNNMVKKLRIEK